MAFVKKNAPVLVTVFAVLTLIMGVIFLMVGVSLLIGDSSAATQDEGKYDALMASAIALALGISMLTVGFGMLQGCRIMWYVAVVVYWFALACSLISCASNVSSIFAAIIIAAILFYLHSNSVKAHFVIG